MKKKIGFIAAVLHKPELLILDEPFSGLDPLAARKCVDFINLYRNDRRTVFLSSHDISYVEQVATHVIVLDQQKFIYRGSLTNFTKNGSTQISKALLELFQPDSQKSISSLFRSFHPVSSGIRYVLNNLNDFVSVYFMIVSIFILACFAFSSTLSQGFFVLSVLALSGAHTTRRMMQTWIEYSIRYTRSYLLLFLLSLLSALLSILSLVFYGIPVLWAGSWLLVSVISAGFVLEELCPKEVASTSKSGRQNRSAVLDMMIHNKKVRNALVLAFTFKVGMLTLDLTLYPKLGGHFAYTNHLLVFFLFQHTHRRCNEGQNFYSVSPGLNPDRDKFFNAACLRLVLLDDPRLCGNRNYYSAMVRENISRLQGTGIF